MADYGPAVTWIVILFVLFVTGIIYMMMTPLIDYFINLGFSSGADPYTMAILRDSIKTYFPVVVIFSLIAYGWRKSKSHPGY